jgi:hypothetical protein
MNSIILRCIAAALSFAAGAGAVLGVQWMTQPRTYSGCVLKYVKSGMSNDAVAQVDHACQLKFGKPDAR